MTAEHFRAGSYVSQNDEKPEGRGNFCSPGRVKTVTQGSKPQSNSRLVEHPGLDQQPQGTIHRNSVDRITPLEPDHAPFTSIHRPEPSDIQSLKKHQAAMLTDRAKKKRRGTSSK